MEQGPSNFYEPGSSTSSARSLPETSHSTRTAMPGNVHKALPPIPPHMHRPDSSTGLDESDSDSDDLSSIAPSYYARKGLIDYSEFRASGKGMDSSARMRPDGQIDMFVDVKASLPQIPLPPPSYAPPVHEDAIETDPDALRAPPMLNIVIMIVGSRGDVQPFIALAKGLQLVGHRVRIATHSSFESFVHENGIEFYAIGGNEKELMKYMVQNPGLIPGLESIRQGDIGKKRTMLAEIMDGCWKACYADDPATGKTFAADAIVSNPPAFAHIHCAEALGVPLLLSFTMPWTSTRSFPHPLVNIEQSNAEPALSNLLSYPLVEMMTWQGMGDVVNAFRKKTLGLHKLNLRTGPGIVERLRVPWTYCMSPALIPKPEDWMNHIDVVGFYFLDLAADYQPPADLKAFLDAGPPPVYIGFGSVVVEDAEQMTRIIFEAVERSGVRALVSVGWGGLGSASVPPSVLLIGNCPHDWLFTRVSAVVHHGGAGTTAIGLKLGKPTLIVPFFGDQPFWGQMVYRAGAGPKPIKIKDLRTERLTEALLFVITPQAQVAARKLADKIAHEDGVWAGVESFHRHLPLRNMRCDLDTNLVAVWWSTKHYLRLSAFAAHVLIAAKKISGEDLDPHRSRDYQTRVGASDPLSASAQSLFWIITHWTSAISKLFYNPVQGAMAMGMAVPRSVFKVVGTLYEGLHNLPKAYGSDVREPGKVNSFWTGLAEGGKDLAFGFSDGISGLVLTPYKGAKQAGWAGGMKGLLRSWSDVGWKPAAGAIGFIVHPSKGAWRSMQKLWTVKQTHRQRVTRLGDGVAAYQAASDAARTRIIQAFHEAVEKTVLRARQKHYMLMAEERILAEQEQHQRAEERAGIQPTVDQSSVIRAL